MENPEKRKFYYSALFPSLFIAILWLIKGIEIEFGVDFASYGILPRNIEGLRGVILAPLIHGDMSHLFNNSVPLFILGWAMFYFYRSIAFRLAFWSYVLAGLYTWISARSSYHIGASGLVYALFGFIFISGFIRRYTPLIALSFLVIFLYGSLVWGILPWDKKISWEGHFWGLFVGLILAIYYRKLGPQKKKYEWEEESEDEDEFEELSQNHTGGKKQLNVVYRIVPKESDDDASKD